MNQINENTKISLPVKVVYTLSICFASATFWLAGIYGESKGLPARVAKLEERSAMICRVLKRIQESTVPVPYREEMDCR